MPSAPAAMQLHIHHHTRYRYHTPVVLAQHMAYLQPNSSVRQTVCSHTRACHARARVCHASTMPAQCANAVHVLRLGLWRQCSE